MAKFKKPQPKKDTSPAAEEKDAPLVSIIVPMYNDEEYISELLESVLAQTLENFELIIVDDCSTDNCCGVVESYATKFGGRLKLIKSMNNKGAGAQRNKGLGKSCGKYVFFMDSDDILTKTALEEMYNVAEEFQADVIYCEKYYMSKGKGEEFVKNMHIATTRIQSGGFVDKPTAISDDLAVRVKEWLNGRFWMTPWLRFSLRSFLVENKIHFQPLAHQNDYGWTLEELCLAKKFVRVPNVCYVRRMRDDSLSAKKKTLNNHIHRYMEKTVRGLKMIDDFIGNIDFFKEHPEFRYAVLQKWIMDDLKSAQNSSGKIPPHIIRQTFEKEFKDELGEHATLISYLFSMNIAMIKSLREAKRVPAKIITKGK